jgi:acyl-ACP thioesterase
VPAVARPSDDRPDLVGLPASGRVFRTHRTVRLGDVAVSDRLRLDAVARYLQDVARDDSADSGLPDPMSWVVRRTVMAVHRAPVFQSRVDLVTWCSGVGGRWAERRTSLGDDQGLAVDAAAVWVHLDPVSGRPARLSDRFHELYAEAAAGRKADAGLAHGTPPDGAPAVPWPLRATDFDLLGHVNNAAYWEVLEEVLVLAGLTELATGGLWAECEHRDAAEPGAQPSLCWERRDDGGVDAWLVSDEVVHASYRLRPLAG